MDVGTNRAGGVGEKIHGRGQPNSRRTGAATFKRNARPFFRVDQMALSGRFSLSIYDGKHYHMIGTYDHRETAASTAHLIAKSFRQNGGVRKNKKVGSA